MGGGKYDGLKEDESKVGTMPEAKKIYEPLGDPWAKLMLCAGGRKKTQSSARGFFFISEGKGTAPD